MAVSTNINLRKKVIYSIYVRNHTEQGTFEAVIPDLKRIRDLGTDIIWFMPIHPIGEKGKKGTLGCPYANKDYRDVNPMYGTMEDFKQLVEEIHKLGMKCIIDVVYNHTSPDSWLVKNHEEFFYKKENGQLGNKVGDWTDVVDLDYSNKDLWRYQVDSLKMWAGIVDGFRCDVASLLPMDFWKMAREEVAQVNPECIWLAESIHKGFVKYLRDNRVEAHSDSEVYEAFDITYEYDIWDEFVDYIEDKCNLSKYVDALMSQESVYPENYVKLRCLENHDQDRIKKRIASENDIINFTAFNYFQRGTVMIYAGQEFENDKLPSLFEFDKIDRKTGCDLSQLMGKLYEIKQNKLFIDGALEMKAIDDKDIVVAKYKDKSCDNKVIGLFCLKNSSTNEYYPVDVDLQDGSYINSIDNTSVDVKNGKILPQGKPIIIFNN